MRTTQLSLAALVLAIGCESVPTVDPNSAAQPDSGQGATPPVSIPGGSVRVQIVNRAPNAANTSTSMELAEILVHSTQRRVNAGGGTVVVGPDRADFVTVNATMEGTPTRELAPSTFSFGADFASGAVIRVEIDAFEDPNDTSRPPPDNENANSNTNDNTGDGNQPPTPPPPPTLSLDLKGFEAPRVINAGEHIPFTVSATGVISSTPTLRVFADVDGDTANGNEIVLFESSSAGMQTGEWDTLEVAPATYYLFAEVDDGSRFLRIGPAPGTVRVNASPTIQFVDPADSRPVSLGSPTQITFVALDTDDAANVQLFLDIDQQYSGDELVVFETTSTPTAQPTETTIDLSELLEGSYYLGARLDDGIAPPVVKYGPELCLSARTLGVRRLSTTPPGEVSIVRDADEGAVGATLRTVELGTALWVRYDVTGDGRADLVITDARADRFTEGKGSLTDAGALLLFAPAEGWPDLLRPSDARLAILGDRDGGMFGASLAIHPNVTSEDFTEALVGGPRRGLTHPNDGSAVALTPLVLRRLSGVQPLESIPPALRPSFTGSPDRRELAGSAVTALGDMNSDCRTDAAIGSPAADANAGRVAVLFRPVPRSQDISLDRVGEDVPGVLLNGAAAGDEAGASVAPAGLRNIGVPDPTDCAPSAMLIGAPGADQSAGRVYYVGLDPTDPRSARSLADVGGSGLPGVIFAGESAGDRAGSTVASLDFDGDGARDLVLAAPGAAGGRGRVYVIFGAALPHFIGTAPISLALVGVELPGFVVDGPTAAAQLGFALANAGDIDQDGFEDLLIGAPGHDAIGPDTGAAYLVYGSPVIAPRFSADQIGLRCDALGWQFIGEKAHLRLGAALAGGGDLDGNGAPDAAIGAPGSRELEILGEAYVLFSTSLGGDKTRIAVPPNDGVP